MRQGESSPKSNSHRIWLLLLFLFMAQVVVQSCSCFEWCKSTLMCHFCWVVFAPKIWMLWLTRKQCSKFAYFLWIVSCTHSSILKQAKSHKRQGWASNDRASPEEFKRSSNTSSSGNDFKDRRVLACVRKLFPELQVLLELFRFHWDCLVLSATWMLMKLCKNTWPLFNVRVHHCQWCY